MSDRFLVHVSRRLPDSVEARLAEHFQVKLNLEDQPMDRTALRQSMAEADALLCTVSDRIGAELISDPQRKVGMIANFGVGFSNIDVEAARAAGVVVSNTPDVLTEATADLALLLILAATRRARLHEQRLREGRWQGFSLVDGLGMGLQGRTLGVIGMGRIGRATAARAVNGFGMKVIYFNRSAVADPGVSAEACDSVETLLAQSDVVSLHTPGGGEALITAERLALMQPHAVLINTARGELVDEAALVQALQQGVIAGAGLDVFAHEPAVPADLLGMEQVTLLPHIGSATRETREAMGMLAVDNLIAHFSDRKYPSRVI